MGEPASVARCSADHRAWRGLEFVRAPYCYVGAGGDLVRRLKFAAEFAAASVLGAAMAEALRDRIVRDFRRAVLVPVPLHRERRRSRGFDQARLLVEEVRARTGLAAAPGALRRLRQTLPQGDPRTTSRDRNVAGAFALADGRLLRDRRVVLVDDVVTSGATARACARVLRDAGAAAVGVVAACRA